MLETCHQSSHSFPVNPRTSSSHWLTQTLSGVFTRGLARQNLENFTNIRLGRLRAQPLVITPGEYSVRVWTAAVILSNSILAKLPEKKSWLVVHLLIFRLPFWFQLLIREHSYHRHWTGCPKLWNIRHKLYRSRSQPDLSNLFKLLDLKKPQESCCWIILPPSLSFLLLFSLSPHSVSLPPPAAFCHFEFPRNSHFTCSPHPSLLSSSPLCVWAVALWGCDSTI